MTKTRLYGIITATIILSIMLGITMISESESQLPAFLASNDVVMIGCSSDLITSFPDLTTTFKVVSTSTSANAPTFNVGAGTNCAQTLADLLDAGFEIENSDWEFNVPQYTFVRVN